MRVNVRFFSYLSHLVGAREIELHLLEPATLADLSSRLQELYPQHAVMLSQAVFLVDQKSASAETELVDGMQVLALMVLSGG